MREAPIVAFIDDDCVPDPGWLLAVLEAARAAQGGSRSSSRAGSSPCPEQRDQLTPLSHTIEVNGPSRLFVSCNIAYSRKLLDQLGGFDETFEHASGEDVELGARAVKAGATSLFAGDALVHHEVRQLTLRQLLRHTWKWTDGVRVLSMHPELRDLLIAKLFWKPTHPRLLLVARRARQPSGGVVLGACVPYVLHYRRVYHGRWLSLARALPKHVVVDSAEIATMLAGSIRYRTWML